MEGFCFPLLHCHGEPGYTNNIKSHMSPDEYVMASLLRPEKLGFEYMTAQAVYPPHFNVYIVLQVNLLHLLNFRVTLKCIS